jgi:hypothetical protein
MNTAAKRKRRVALLGAAAAGLVAATISVVPAHATSAFAAESAEWEPSEIRVLAFADTLDWWQTKPVPAAECPGGHRYLVNHDYAPSRNVPNGVEVIENKNSIAITISETTLQREGAGERYPAVGWKDSWENGMGNTQWVYAGIEVWLHCTNDPARGY